MSKVTMPIAEVQKGGSLENLYYDSALIRTNILKSTTETEAIAEGVFKMTITEVNSVLTAGGEVEGYLMAIKAVKSLFDEIVPAGLPKRLSFNGVAKIFDSWLVPGAEVWLKDDDSEIIFYTNPFAGNENFYLKGSEIKIIHQMPDAEAITIEEAENETASGWTKL